MPLQSLLHRPLRQLLVGAGVWLLLALPVQAAPCFAITTGSQCAFRPEEAAPVQVRLKRRGEQVTVRLRTLVTPVPAWGQASSPLFLVPPGFQPPLTLRRVLIASAVQGDGTPDPAHPDPLQLQLWVTPEGKGRYVADAIPEGVRFLAYDGHLAWGTSLLANEQVVLEILDDRWLGSTQTYRPRPAVQRSTRDREGRISALQLDHGGLTVLPPVLWELT